MDKCAAAKAAREADEVIHMENSPELLALVNEISEYIVSLPLTTEQNDKLVHILTEFQNQARKDAFTQGFELGIKVMTGLLSDITTNCSKGGQQ